MILIEANINIKTQEFYFFNLYVSSYFLQGLLTSKPVRIPIYDYKERILMPRLVLRVAYECVCERMVWHSLHPNNRNKETNIFISIW